MNMRFVVPLSALALLMASFLPSMSSLSIATSLAVIRNGPAAPMR